MFRGLAVLLSLLIDIPAGAAAGPGRYKDPWQPEQHPPIQQLSIKTIYSPTQATDQQTVYNPMSTSHNYLQRFGLAKHF